MNPSTLGVTLPHEHMKIDVGLMFVPPASTTAPPVRDLSNVPFELQHSGWISRYPYVAMLLTDLSNFKKSNELK